jgi:uncharacterized RDD family membrane protein YckC
VLWGVSLMTDHGDQQTGADYGGQCQNGHRTPAGALFCPQCSLPLAAARCSRGHTVEAMQRFCPMCGESVGAWRTGVLSAQQVRPYGDQVADWWAASGNGASRRLAGPDAATLLSYPRTGMWRRVGAALIDYLLASAALALGPVSLLVICLYGYFEGTTGQTLGKKALGIYTIRADTGEFIGGATGIGRKLLHFLDTLALFTGWIIGLITGRTYADRIIGTVVVRRPKQSSGADGYLPGDKDSEEEHIPATVVSRLRLPDN